MLTYIFKRESSRNTVLLHRKILFHTTINECDCCSVADQHRFNDDQDPTFHFDAYPDPSLVLHILGDFFYFYLQQRHFTLFSLSPQRCRCHNAAYFIQYINRKKHNSALHFVDMDPNWCRSNRIRVLQLCVIVYGEAFL
jgi:hypothetical protein